MRPIPGVLCAVLALAAALAGCQSSAPLSRTEPAQLLPPTPDSATAGNLSREELQAANRLYIAKCARCHKFYDPAAYNDAEWQIWMSKMSRKARLKPDQAQLLARYLEAFRAARK